METQNITLALPKELLLKAKLIAVKRRTSLSKLLTQALEEMVQQEDDYSQAQRRHLAWLESGADLGTAGRPPAMRDELHDR